MTSVSSAIGPTPSRTFAGSQPCCADRSLTRPEESGHMDKFDEILNWELKAGSHTFPGPDGGTCINEAAIVAMGFPYKAIGSASDCPPCFSRVFSSYAIRINDAMPDRLRNKLLMPFVMRLGGTADAPDIENERFDYLRLQNIRRVLPIFLRRAGLEDAALGCEQARTVREARELAALAHQRATSHRRAVWPNYPSWPPKPVAAAVAEAVAAAVAVAAVVAVVAAVEVEAAVEVVRRFWLSLDDKVWIESVNILDEAMKIGRQADPIDMLQVRDRMDLVRQKVGA